ncbi:MAG: hypothetical protein M1828_002632 [Chrysothrix sp. TS-e1954]|nr:MAG: hypothetical protein M1828_002632 [Chrysothrix sp. TS-e1954]
MNGSNDYSLSVDACTYRLSVSNGFKSDVETGAGSSVTSLQQTYKAALMTNSHLATGELTGSLGGCPCVDPFTDLASRLADSITASVFTSSSATGASNGELRRLLQLLPGHDIALLSFSTVGISSSRSTIFHIFQEIPANSTKSSMHLRPSLCDYYRSTLHEIAAMKYMANDMMQNQQDVDFAAGVIANVRQFTATLIVPGALFDSAAGTPEDRRYSNPNLVEKALDSLENEETSSWQVAQDERMAQSDPE